jgi:hypothetical protein
MNADTKFVGVKEFRQNMAELAKVARQKNQKIVVMNRNQPLFEVMPYAPGNDLSTLVADIATARRDVAEGRVYTHEQIKAELFGE